MSVSRMKVNFALVMVAFLVVAISTSFKLAQYPIAKPQELFFTESSSNFNVIVLLVLTPQSAADIYRNDPQGKRAWSVTVKCTMSKR